MSTPASELKVGDRVRLTGADWADDVEGSLFPTRGSEVTIKGFYENDPEFTWGEHGDDFVIFQSGSHDFSAELIEE